MKFKYTGTGEGRFYDLGIVKPREVYDVKNDENLLRLIRKSSDFVEVGETKKKSRRRKKWQHTAQ